MVQDGYCDYRCFLAGGVYVEECYDWDGQAICYDTCSFGDDNELCEYPYFPSWSDEPECDTYCVPNSGVLGDDDQCHYENMETGI